MGGKKPVNVGNQARTVIYYPESFLLNDRRITILPARIYGKIQDGGSKRKREKKKGFPR